MARLAPRAARKRGRKTYQISDIHGIYLPSSTLIYPHLDHQIHLNTLSPKGDISDIRYQFSSQLSMDPHLDHQIHVPIYPLYIDISKPYHTIPKHIIPNTQELN